MTYICRHVAHPKGGQSACLPFCLSVDGSECGCDVNGAHLIWEFQQCRIFLLLHSCHQPKWAAQPPPWITVPHLGVGILDAKASSSSLDLVLSIYDPQFAICIKKLFKNFHLIRLSLSTQMCAGKQFTGIHDASWWDDVRKIQKLRWKGNVCSSSSKGYRDKEGRRGGWARQVG